MIPLIGYADRLSARPGETIAFKISSAGPGPFTARIVRVICADPNPAGPGILEEAVPSSVDGEHPSTPRTTHLGSYMRAPWDPALSAGGFSVEAVIWPTRPDSGREQGVFSLPDPVSGNGFVLYIGADGCLTARTAEGGQIASTGIRLEPRAWVRVAAGVGADGRPWVATSPSQSLQGSPIFGPFPQGEGEKRAAPTPQGRGEILGTPSLQRGGEPAALIGTIGEATGAGRFNGKIARVRVWRGMVPARDAAGRTASVDGLIAAWAFAAEIGTRRVPDAGPHGLDGTLVNLPTRAMTGPDWDGSEMCWRHKPSHYDAIHFHETDFEDCRWPTSFAFTIPKDMRSGVYAVRLQCGEHNDNIPFFVVPPEGKATAKLAVLVSTYTYTIYANHARPEYVRNPAWQERWHERVRSWGGYPHHPADHPELGWSTYNYHSDGSGISISSWHRPMLNVRVGFVSYPYDIYGSGLRHFPADSHLTAWLEHAGIAYDVITDHELHHEGVDLLRPYACVMTGTHPEYHTREMLDALTAYRDGGGRLMYMGGNGFYWKIALEKERPGIIEIRRGEGGIRAWAAEPGEYYNAFDGEYGGLWRRNGRPPQHLTGVGFTAQGNFIGSYYRLRPEARDPRVAWMLEGVECQEGDKLGGYGLSGHGAAGFELDRAEKRLGTPANAIVVASSEDHKPDTPWVLVPEEQLTHIVTLAGPPAEELIRADLTFFETAGGKGAVFSTGSITWCGSLPHNAYENGISRLTLNVVQRFLDPAPFEVRDQTPPA